MSVFIARHTWLVKRLSRVKWRVLLRKLHLFLGLSFGLLFSFLGITGGLLVFEHEIDEQLNPALLTVSEPVHSYALDKILAAAMAHDKTFRAERLETPRSASGVFLIRGKHIVGSEQQHLDILINPTNNEVLGSRVWGEYAMSFIYKLHYTLLLGESGSRVVGITGFMLLVMATTGIVLWWPKKGKWKQAMRIKWRAKPIRIVWDFHRCIGFFSSVLLMVIALSGFYMTFSHYANPIVNWISPLTPPPENPASKITANNVQITLHEVAKIADSTFPETELKRIYFPKSPNGVFQVVKREPNSAIKSGGYSRVWIDQYSGEVLALRSAKTFTPGDYFVSLQFPLHNGKAMGLPGRLLVISVSVVPLVLFLTGFFVWRKRSVAQR